jgi:antitoxin VapB
MALNIKNEQTVALARQLAEATGESLTEAVTEALSQRLERVRSDTDHEARVDRLWEQALQMRRERDPDAPILSEDDLYDPETGLPV